MSIKRRRATIRPHKLIALETAAAWHYQSTDCSPLGLLSPSVRHILLQWMLQPCPTQPTRLCLAFFSCIVHSLPVLLRRGVYPLSGREPALWAMTRDFQAIMYEARQSGSYARMIAVLVVAEWTHLKWASPFNPPAASLPFYFSPATVIMGSRSIWNVLANASSPR